MCPRGQPPAPHEEPVSGASPAWEAAFQAFEACDGFRELRSLCRRIAHLESQGGAPKDRSPLRIALIGGATLKFLAEPLRVALLARGFLPNLFVGGYGQFVAEMLQVGGPLDDFLPQVTVVMNTPFNISRWPALDATHEEVRQLVERACEDWLGPCRRLNERLQCDILLNTVHPFPGRGHGNFGAHVPGDSRNFVRRVNMALGDRAPAYVHLNDVAAMAGQMGMDRWLDMRFWYEAKQPLAFDAVPEYVRNTASIIGALFGRRRKVAVLDLDNTLWGGVVGDDGIAGIQVGEGTAAGEAFKALQVYLRELKETGVLLAVCSKNDQDIAKRAFREHPEMVLKLDDFVAFKANWNPKSDNILAIARELDLGLSSFVFIDDNPAEREQVRQALPDVAVPELGSEPAHYTQELSRTGYFESVSVTDEDRKRTATYQARAAAVAAEAESTDLSEYLKSLQMRARIRAFDAHSMQRLTQLINKTNQFNLTTVRVTQPEMEGRAADPDYFTCTLRLRDKFGDHGLVSVLWARLAPQRMIIENWVMSCRVLRRGAEQAIIEHVLSEARSRAISLIEGTYLPTARNGIVSGLYEELGFHRLEELPGGGSTWTLSVSEAPRPRHYLTMEPETSERGEDRDD